VKDMLRCSSAMSILSGNASLPLSESEASRLLNIISNLSDTHLSGKIDRTMSWVIGTLMKLSLDNKISSKYFRQQPLLRIAQNQKPLLRWILRRICFLSILSTYENALGEIYISGIISTSGWAIFVDKLRKEASDLMLIATVLLNANVAFLAIPLGNHNARILSYLSIVTSLASIASGFGTQHAGWSNFRPQSISQSWCRDFIVLSAMPLVCLIWAFAFFCLAVFFMIFASLPVYAITLIGIFAIGSIYALFQKLSHPVFSHKRDEIQWSCIPQRGQNQDNAPQMV